MPECPHPHVELVVGVAGESLVELETVSAQHTLGSDDLPSTATLTLQPGDTELTVDIKGHAPVLLTSADVIHSWWVPQLSVKKDAVPGFVNESWFVAEETGIFRGQCTELCGQDHGFMPVVVNIVEEAAGYKRLMVDFSMKEERIAKKVGRSVQTVKDTIKLNVDKAGTYDFLCDVHPTMKGELTVK